ncbi:hypothetical protein [Burkholderia sp. Tr-20390]|uniref:hypothetical protein n=1 Tax=Burkholderia sp. Tr-20390 TaxID=2703904 RepID=UPI001981DF9D|nr:hypothetical protein [Burkholderia sp. Tr-20390]MBN3729486.1 hypothetical protein [Burkholderia sp. Tr-20390]
MALKNAEMLIRSSPDSTSATCRICRKTFVTDNADDVRAHHDEHKALAKGAMPLVIREMLKGFGYAIAHNDGGLDRLKDCYTAEDGTLAVAYSWWSRALTHGVPTADFDDYMAAHIHYADALTGRTGVPIEEAGRAIKRWERYAG